MGEARDGYDFEVGLCHVSLEGRHLGEARGTLGAGVRLFTRVEALMLDEVLLRLEPAVTERARERA